MADDAGENGSNGAASPAFDSLANLRALGEIQRRGLEAANLVVGRLIERVDRSGPLFGAEPAAGGAAPSAPADAMADAPADVMAQYADLWSSFVSALFAGAPTGAGSGGAAGASRAESSAPPDGAVVADPLVVEPAPPGGRARGELWLHNRSGAPVTGVRLHGGDLRRHDGSAIAASALTFDPERIEELPDLSSRGVRVTVEVPDDAQPGTYRTTVMAANLPDVWLVLELSVVAA